MLMPQDDQNLKAINRSLHCLAVKIKFSVLQHKGILLCNMTHVCLFRQGRWDSIHRSANSVAIVYQETWRESLSCSFHHDIELPILTCPHLGCPTGPWIIWNTVDNHWMFSSKVTIETDSNWNRQWRMQEQFLRVECARATCWLKFWKQMVLSYSPGKAGFRQENLELEEEALKNDRTIENNQVGSRTAISRMDDTMGAAKIQKPMIWND